MLYGIQMFCFPEDLTVAIDNIKKYILLMVLVSGLGDVHSWHPPKLPNTWAPFKYVKYLHKIAFMFYNTTIEQ